MTSRLRRALTIAIVTGCLAASPASGESDPVGEWPLRPQPEVERAFDPPAGPYGAGHRGVDLAGAVGQTVHAALAGSVTYAGLLAGRGVVVVDHGSTRTTYEPVDPTVTIGQQVALGAPLGTLGQAGSHCPPRACLHWGWVAGETYLDPLRLVGAGPVRLLPLWGEAPGASESKPRRALPRSPTESSRLRPPVVRLADALVGMQRAVGRW